MEKNNLIVELPSYRITGINSAKSSLFGDQITIQRLKNIMASPSINQSSCKKKQREEVKSAHPHRNPHKVTHRRGIKPQRMFYQQLQSQIQQIQSSIPQINNISTTAQLMLYKEKYIANYLSLFFKQLGNQCYEKQQFIRKLWDIIRNIFEHLINKLCSILNENQKQFLSSSLQYHSSYLQKIEEMQKTIKKRQQALNKMQGHLSGVAKKNNNKNKKNKQLTITLGQVCEKMIQMENECEQVKSQLLNSLILGNPGGYTDQQARRYVEQRFSSFKFTKTIQQSKKKMKEIVFKVKKKFKPIMVDGELKRSQNAQNMQNEKDKINEDNNEQIKQFKSTKTQVNLDNRRQITSFATNFNIFNKFKQGLMKNTQCQTPPLKNIAKPITLDAQTQCNFPSPVKVQTPKIQKYTQKQEFVFVPKQNINQIQKIESVKSEIQVQSPADNRFSEEVEIKIEEQKENVKELKIKKSNMGNKRISTMKSKRNNNNVQKVSIFKRRQSAVSYGSVTNNLGKLKEKKDGEIRESERIKTQSSDTGVKSAQYFGNLAVIRGQNKQQELSSDRSDSSSEETENDEDYKRTEILNVLQNISFLSPQGVYIDETMLFLLKKSLFKVKHEKNKNILNRNSKLINRIRASRDAIIGKGNTRDRRSLMLVNLRLVLKVIYQVYDSISAQIHSNNPPENISLLKVLKICLQKQYPTNKSQQIQHKMAIFTRSMQCYSNSHYIIKNFIFLSCINDSIYSPIIYSSDIFFYFQLLRDLNCHEPEPGKNSHQFNFTTVEKLYKVISTSVKQSLCNIKLVKFIQKKVGQILQKNGAQPQTRLDIYKCCQLMIEAYMEFKLQFLKSYAQLASSSDLTTAGLITQELFIDILGFLGLTKLQTLNIINKLRYEYSRKNTFKGISLIDFVNFCLKNNIPSFDQILIGVCQKYPIPLTIKQHVIEKYIDMHTDRQKLQILNLEQDEQQHYIRKIGKISVLMFRKRKVLKQPIYGSLNLVHCKIVEYEANLILQSMIGADLTTLYAGLLCQLQQKKK